MRELGDRGGEHRGIDRLRQMHLKSAAKRPDAILGACVGGDRRGRYAAHRLVRRRAHARDQLEAVDARHREVGDEHVGTHVADQFQRICRRWGRGHFGARRFEDVADHRERVRIIVDDENTYAVQLVERVRLLDGGRLGIVWLFKVVFDMSLTPVITAFGVGGLAVALALQDTLSNLFAGFYVSISHLVRLGDYIKLSTGEEGYVTDINWRCTTIRTGSNNMTVIPNNKLGTTIYTNYNLPDGRMGLSISFGVASDTDIERMEAILLDEAKASAADIAGLMVDPPPSVFFTPGEWSLNFQLNFSVSQFGDQFPVQSQLRKRIYKRLLKESIRMPLPTKAVVVESKSASA